MFYLTPVSFYLIINFQKLFIIKFPHVYIHQLLQLHQVTLGSSLCILQIPTTPFPTKNRVLFWE